MQSTFCFALIQVIKDNKILLIKRAKTGVYENTYSLVGGQIDGNESAKQAAVREVFEEVGITVNESDLKFAGVIHEKATKENTKDFIRKKGLITNVEHLEFIGFSFIINNWEGIPFNKEPNKHEYIKWFDLDNLPKELLPLGLKAIEMAKNGQYYFECGWK